MTAVATQKLQRTYELKVEGDPLTPAKVPTIYTIRYPLTLEFEVARSVQASLNTARLSIRNLGPTTRRGLFHDLYAVGKDDIRIVQLNAGYQTDATLPVVFRGNVQTASSWRDGVDWVTEITALDGGAAIANGQVDVTKSAGWNFADLIGTIVGAMGPTVGLNAIGDIQVPNSRGVTVSGNAWDSIQRFNPYGLNFIDNGGVNVLGVNEALVVPGSVPLLTSAAGILGTPRRYRERVEVQIMFEPRVSVGQIVEVKSLESVNNGPYRVNGFRHVGRISGAVDDGVVTTLNLWIGASRLTTVTGRNVRGFSL